MANEVCPSSLHCSHNTEVIGILNFKEIINDILSKTIFRSFSVVKYTVITF